MFLPGGNTKEKPMRMEHSNIEKLLDSIKKDYFTGYCEFKTKNYSIVLLLEKGEIQRYFRLEEDSATILPVSAARAECKTMCEVKEVALPPEIVNMMVHLLFFKPLHQNLSSLADFKMLLKTLEADNFTGYIEMKARDDVHYLHLVKGGPRSALYLSGMCLHKADSALIRIFDMNMAKALINIYSLEKVPFKETFSNVSKTLLLACAELKGPKITRQLWERLSFCAQNVDHVSAGDLEFYLEDLPNDPLKQEKILVSLLKCQIKQFSDEIGEKPVRTLYHTLLKNMKYPVKEILTDLLDTEYTLS
jgi:hypothetical protein